MITEDYVSFDIAKFLKEKGFVVPYDSFRGVYINGEFLRRNPGQGYLHNMDDEIIDVCSLQMAMKWLREKHNIHIEIGYNMGYFPVCISTKTNDTIPYIAMGSPFTYEKACEVAIKYCLEYLI